MPQQPTPVTALPSTIIPPRIVKYKSPKTGQEYSFNWDKPNDPTLEDYSKLKKSIEDYEGGPTADEQNIDAATTPKEPSAYSRLGEAVKGMGEMYGSSIITNPLKLAKTLYDPIGAVKGEYGEAKKYATDFATEGVKSGENPLLYTGKKAAEAIGVPVSNLMEDYRTGAWGAGAVDLAQGALSLYGAHEAFSPTKPLPPIKPKVTVVPPVDIPTPKDEGILSLPPGPAPRAPRALLGPPRESSSVPGQRFTAGEKIADLTDPNTANTFGIQDAFEKQGRFENRPPLPDIDPTKDTLPPIETLPIEHIPEVDTSVVDRAKSVGSGSTLSGKTIPELINIAKTADAATTKAIREELARRRAAGGSTLSSGGLQEASRILRDEFNSWRVLKNLPENEAAFQQFLKDTGRAATYAGASGAAASEARNLPPVEPVEAATREPFPNPSELNHPIGRNLAQRAIELDKANAPDSAYRDLSGSKRNLNISETWRDRIIDQIDNYEGMAREGAARGKVVLPPVEPIKAQGLPVRELPPVEPVGKPTLTWTKDGDRYVSGKFMIYPDRTTSFKSGAEQMVRKTGMWNLIHEGRPIRSGLLDAMKAKAEEYNNRISATPTQELPAVEPAAETPKPETRGRKGLFQGTERIPRKDFPTLDEAYFNKEEPVTEGPKGKFYVHITPYEGYKVAETLGPFDTVEEAHNAAADNAKKYGAVYQKGPEDINQHIGDTYGQKVVGNVANNRAATGRMNMWRGHITTDEPIKAEKPPVSKSLQSTWDSLTPGPVGEYGRTLIRNVRNKIEKVIRGDYKTPEEIPAEHADIIENKIMPQRAWQMAEDIRSSLKSVKRNFGVENIPGQYDEYNKVAAHLDQIATRLEDESIPAKQKFFEVVNDILRPGDKSSFKDPYFDYDKMLADMKAEQAAKAPPAPKVEPVAEKPSRPVSGKPDLSKLSTKDLAEYAKTVTKSDDVLEVRKEVALRRRRGETISSGGLQEASSILKAEFDKWRVLRNLPENEAAFKQFLDDTGRVLNTAGRVVKLAPPPEPGSAPYSQGIQERLPEKADIIKRKGLVIDPETGLLRKRTIKFPEAAGPASEQAIRNKVISGENLTSGDYLGENPLYRTVPSAVRPEAPNVTGLRALSEGSLPPVEEPVSFQDQSPSGIWSKPPTTLEMGEGLESGSVEPPKLNYPPSGIPSNRVGPITQAVIDRLKASQKLAGVAESAQRPSMFVTDKAGNALRFKVDAKGNFITNMATGELIPDPLGQKVRLPQSQPVEQPKGFKSGQGFIPPETITEPIGTGKQSLREQLKATAEAAKAKAEAAKNAPKEPSTEPGTIRAGKKITLDNPTPERLAELKKQGWDVTKKFRKGGVEITYTGVDPATVEGGLGSGLSRAFYNSAFVKKNPAFKAIMDKLISYRSADSLIGKGIRDKFAGISDIPKEQLPKFQAELAAGKHPEVRAFFDNLHKKMTNLGIDLGLKENYLPQLWDNTKEEIAKVFGDKQLNAKASFQLHSFIEDYAEGMSKGLKPKMSPIELMDWYGRRANKLIADSAALKELKAKGYLVESEKALPGMEKMDPNLGSFGGYYAHPDVKTVIENYLKSEPKSIGAGVSKAVGKGSSLALSSGFFKNTPLATFHGTFMSLVSAYEGGPKRFLQAIKYGLDPKKAAAFLKEKNEGMINAIQNHQANFSVEDPSGQTPHLFTNEEGMFGGVKKGVNKLIGLQHKYFEAPLFEKMIPALKYSAWEDHFNRLVKAGKSEAEAGAAATKITDSYYSGKNIDLLYNNKAFNRFMRTALLAPDWFRSAKTLGIDVPASVVRILKDPSNPVTQAHLKTAGKIVAAYAAANLLQKGLTGKFMVQNEPKDLFNLDTGDDSTGQKRRSIKLFPSNFSLIELPFKMLASGLRDKGTSAGETFADSIENRLSTLGQFGLDFFRHEDYKGEPNIMGSTDRFGHPVSFGQRLANTFSQAVNAGPPQVAGPYGYLTGRMSAEEAAARVGEWPTTYRYKKQPKPPSFDMPTPKINFPRPRPSR